MIRVGVVDDQILMTEGLVAILRGSDEVEVAWTAGDGVAALEAHASDPVDVVLLDVRMPRMGGVETCERLNEAPRAPKIIMLTTYNIDAAVVQALQAGARGFLLKDVEPQDLIAGVRRIHAGGTVLSSEVTDGVVAEIRLRNFERGVESDMAPRTPRPSEATRDLISRITEREREVLGLIGAGLTNLEIASRLYVAETTVKSHVRSLLFKLDKRDRVALAVFAHQADVLAEDTGRQC